MCTRRHLAYLDDQAGWSGEMILHLDDQAGCCSGVEVLRKHPPITWLEEAQISFAALLLQMQLLFKLTTQDTQTHSHKHKNTQIHTHRVTVYLGDLSIDDWSPIRQLMICAMHGVGFRSFSSASTSVLSVPDPRQTKAKWQILCTQTQKHRDIFTQAQKHICTFTQTNNTQIHMLTQTQTDRHINTYTNVSMNTHTLTHTYIYRHTQTHRSYPI